MLEYQETEHSPETSRMRAEQRLMKMSKVEQALMDFKDQIIEDDDIVMN